MCKTISIEGYQYESLFNTFVRSDPIFRKTPTSGIARRDT